ncbi:MAG: transglycosylase SLT domain-containing protein [Anaerolineales bacterium]|nr:transglycosylase SLT domain-containing protein [Anaerolineales bacterium]
MLKNLFERAAGAVKSETVARIVPPGIALLTGLALFGLSTRPGSAAHDRPAGPAASSPVAAFFTPSVRAWESDLVRWSDSYGLDPNLAATVMQIESCGNPRAVSRSGAQGLFQVMPFHFSKGEDMQAPEINARRGLVYLAESLLKSEGDIRRALAGYNGGHGVILRDPADWPAETKRYAYWGEGIYADAAAGKSSSPRLEEWLAAGGASLCETALRK